MVRLNPLQISMAVFSTTGQEQIQTVIMIHDTVQSSYILG